MSALSKSRNVSLRREDGRKLEEESRRMEAKLDMLRRTMDECREGAATVEGGRWKSGSGSKPIRGYAKGVLDAPRPKRVSPSQAPVHSLLETPFQGFASARGQKTEGSVADALAAGGESASCPASARAGAAPGATSGERRAAGNLAAAIGKQSEASQEVEALLTSLQLDRYISIFLENGLDSMDVVQEMQEHHMREVGMAMGHCLKLRKALAELRPSAPASAVDPPSGGASAEASPGSKRRVSFGGVETEQIAKDAPNSKSAGGSLLSGTAFDEQESAASFQEALRAWRGGASKEEEAAPPPKAAPGSFWSTLGDAEVNLERCSTPVKAPTEPGTSDGQTQRDPAPSEEKLCCYHCFKQFYKRFAVERQHPAEAPLTPGSLGEAVPVRFLCSEDCAARWEATMDKKAEAVRKRQEKMDALREAQRALEEQKSQRGQLHEDPSTQAGPAPLVEAPTASS